MSLIDALFFICFIGRFRGEDRHTYWQKNLFLRFYLYLSLQLMLTPVFKMRKMTLLSIYVGILLCFSMSILHPPVNQDLCSLLVRPSHLASPWDLDQEATLHPISVSWILQYFRMHWLKCYPVKTVNMQKLPFLL